jgi:hypothetical protein
MYALLTFTPRFLSKNLFNLDTGLENNTCAKHFYSILGRSGISMLKNINQIAKTKTDIINVLTNANPAIKYEILKNLNWKIKIDDLSKPGSKKYLISVEEWLKKVANQEFNNYLNSVDGLLIKNILNAMIDDINTNSSLLDEKYESSIKQIITNPNYNKKKRILKKEQIKMLQIENLLDKIRLTTNTIYSNI